MNTRQSAGPLSYNMFTNDLLNILDNDVDIYIMQMKIHWCVLDTTMLMLKIHYYVI